MTFDMSALSDDELLALINGQSIGFRESDVQEDEQTTATAQSPRDVKELSDQELLSLIQGSGGEPTQQEKGARQQQQGAGFFKSVGLGALEGATDPLAIAETIGDAIGQEQPDIVRTQADLDAELLKGKDVSDLSFSELFSLTDDDIGPPSLFTPKKEVQEAAAPEARRPFTALQAQLPESENELGRLARRGTRFAVGGLTTGSGGRGALNLGRLGATGQAVREAGGGELLATAFELGAPQAAAKTLGGKFKSGIFPNALAQDLKSTARRLDLKRLPVSVTNERGAANFVENLAQQSVFGQKAYRQLFNEMEGGLLKRFENTLENISNRRLSSLAEGGESLQQQFKKAHQQARSFSRGFYGFAEKGAEGIRVPAQDLIRGLTRASKRLGKTILPESKEAGVKSFIDDFRSTLERLAEKDGRVPLDRLIAQRRSIRSMLNYEDIGGAQEFLKGVDGSMTKTFERVGRQNKEWYKQFRSAEKNFANQAKYFRNKLMKTVMFNESPEAIMNAINKPSDVVKLEKALNVKGINPQTRKQVKDLVDAVKRRKVEDVLLDRVKDSEGKFRFTQRDLIPKNKKEFISSLLDKPGRQTLKDIDKISKAVARGASRFANTSRTFANAQDVAAITSLVRGAVSADPTVFALSASPAAAYWAASKVLTSPTMTSTMTKLEKAARAGNGKRYNELTAVFMADFNELLKKNNLSRAEVLPKEKE